MNALQIILAVLAFAVTAGGISVFFKRGSGLETIKLLQINVAAYQDSEKLKDARITYLEGQLVNANETIKNLNKMIKK